MKRALIVVVLILGLFCAQAESQDFACPFGLSINSTGKEVIEKIQGTFDIIISESGDRIYIENKSFMGMNIDFIQVRASEENEVWNILFRFAPTNIGTNLDGYKRLYDLLVELYGEPSQIAPETINTEFDGTQSAYNIMDNFEVFHAEYLNGSLGAPFSYIAQWDFCAIELTNDGLKPVLEVNWYNFPMLFAKIH